MNTADRDSFQAKRGVGTGFKRLTRKYKFVVRKRRDPLLLVTALLLLLSHVDLSAAQGDPALPDLEPYDSSHSD